MKNTMIAIFFSVCLFSTNEAMAQTRITFAEGWPVRLSDGGDWDSTSSIFLLGLATGWKFGGLWNVGVELQAVTPFTVPHPNPQIIASLGFKVSDFLSLGTGLGYMFVCPYGEKPSREFLVFSVGATIPISKEISFSFLTGPGVTFTNGPKVWTWVFMPKLSFLLPL